jgi:hypothetical protein
MRLLYEVRAAADFRVKGSRRRSQTILFSELSALHLAQAAITLNRKNLCTQKGF